MVSERPPCTCDVACSRRPTAFGIAPSAFLGSLRPLASMTRANSAAARRVAEEIVDETA